LIFRVSILKIIKDNVKIYDKIYDCIPPPLNSTSASIHSLLTSLLSSPGVIKSFSRVSSCTPVFDSKPNLFTFLIHRD